MSSGRGLAQFPDIEAKLQKPTKQSAFEKQRAEAAAKRQREEAENAAVLKDFVESFDDEDDDNGLRLGSRRDHESNLNAPLRARLGMSGGPSGPSKRHFGSSTLKSGPGSLGPAPSGFGKKRSFQDFARGGSRDRAVTLLGLDEEPQGALSQAFRTSDDEDNGNKSDAAEERAIAKPTLRLLNLPPGTSPASIKALISENLQVEGVRILPPSGPGSKERKSSTAIVTLSQETPANEIDAAVSALQHRYMGFGFYLSLHRHLSSAAISSINAHHSNSSTAESHAFGAKPVQLPSSATQRSQQPPGFQKGFAPPSSYNHSLAAGVDRNNLLHVPVKPPNDVRTLQLISRVIEGILEHGPEFEALLMSRPEVQREEKWAWIWDARSTGGVWLRWKLWEVITGGQDGKSKGKYVPIFDGSHAWKLPEKRLPYEFTTKLEEFASDPDYDSSDDEDLEGETANQVQDAEEEKTFLNPLEKAKLTHLLARLPKTLSRLRKGDIARVTTFAILHASRGADEIVDLIVQNVEQPFSCTSANPDKRKQDEREATEGNDVDASTASLVGLYVVSDILSSSSTSGVRHAWRFRQLFEATIRDCRLFETLGSMAEKHKWGRLRADKWKRSISLVLNLWEGWCVFPADSQELFVNSFENHTNIKVESSAKDDATRSGKWKTVEEDGPAQRAPLPLSTETDDVEGAPVDEEDVAGEPVGEEDVDGEPIQDDDIEGEPIEEDDVEGEPIQEDDVGGEPMDQDEVSSLPQPAEPPRDTAGTDTAARTQPRRRMRAVDMFADSDGSEAG